MINQNKFTYESYLSKAQQTHPAFTSGQGNRQNAGMHGMHGGMGMQMNMGINSGGFRPVNRSQTLQPVQQTQSQPPAAFWETDFSKMYS